MIREINRIDSLQGQCISHSKNYVSTQIVTTLSNLSTSVILFAKNNVIIDGKIVFNWIVTKLMMKDYIYLTPYIVPCYVIFEVYNVVKKFDQIIRSSKTTRISSFQNRFQYQRL